MTIGEGMSGYERPQDGDDKSDNDRNAEQEDGDDKSVSPEERPLDGDDKSVLADGEGVEPEESIDDSYPPSSQKRFYSIDDTYPPSSRQMRISIGDSCYPPSSQVETEAINDSESGPSYTPGGSPPPQITLFYQKHHQLNLETTLLQT